MRKFVKWNVVILALAASLVWAAGAYADTLNSWTISGNGISGSGWVTTDSVGSGTVHSQATAISGSITIGTATYMIGPGALIPWNPATETWSSGASETDQTTGYSYDDIINLGKKPQIDDNGLLFQLGSLGTVNLCDNCGGVSGETLWYGGTPATGLGSDYQVTFWVPEPSVMGLLSLGLVGLLLALSLGPKRLRTS